MDDRIIENALLGLAEARRTDFEEFSMDNRALWDSIPQSVRNEVLEEARTISFTKDDYIPLSLYQDFLKTGNRKRYEDVYFAKRRKLSILVLAQCLSNDESFISMIEEGIWAILSEPTWTIPAHNGYVRDTEQLSAPLLERPVLDLFACETGEILALSACVLGGRINPILRADIHSELERRIALPYITDNFWWMGSSGPLNNWSPWCTQNVLIACLSNPRLDAKSRMKVVKQATVTLDSFMASYDEDGGCDEGAGYYHAAALALFGAMSVLERSTGRDFTPVYHNSKTRAMAGYIEDVFIAEDLYLNYADCSPKAGTLSVREYIFAKATGNSAMAHHAALDVMKYGWQEGDNSYNLFYKLLALSNYNEVAAEAERPVSFAPKPYTHFTKTQMSIYREKGLVFAIKGGCNGESHNHNDVGSMILYNGTRPLLVDIGVETYTKTTFSEDRYTLEPMQSLWHNVVNFPPLQQHDGPQFRSQEILSDESTCILDLTKAYEEGKGLDRYIRKVHFNRAEGSIEVEEEMEATATPVLSLITQEKPEIIKDGIDFESFTIHFTKGFAKVESEVKPITDARLRQAWPEKLYRTLVTLDGSAKWTITIKH